MYGIINKDFIKTKLLSLAACLIYKPVIIYFHFSVLELMDFEFVFLLTTGLLVLVYCVLYMLAYFFSLNLQDMFNSRS